MAAPKHDLDRRVDAFIDACRARGLKVTPQRTAVFRELARTEGHPDAETLWARVRETLPAIARDTVYRTLATLEAEGFVRKVDTLGERTRYDADLGAHHHFICTGCGLVRDFESAQLDAFTPPPEVARWGDVEYVQVQLRGLCKACRRKAGKR